MLANTIMRSLILIIIFSTFCRCDEAKDQLGKQLMENSVSSYNISLKLCDRIVLYRLDGGPNDQTNPTNTFPLKPYGNRNCYFSKEKPIRIEDYDRFRTTFALMTKDVYGGQSLCHNPAYGFRFYGADQLIFETSVCFECNNWYLPILHLNDWVSLPGGEDNVKLLSFLREYFPE